MTTPETSPTETPIAMPTPDSAADTAPPAPAPASSGQTLTDALTAAGAGEAVATATEASAEAATATVAETNTEASAVGAEVNGAGSGAGSGEAQTPPAPPPPPIREQEIDEHGRAYATGRRKDAVARVWLKPGTGRILVNGNDQAEYFTRPTLRLIINQPFGVTNRNGQYDVTATVRGGGLSGQAGAVLHGIAQALTRYEPALRSDVKAAGFLTRDSRVVERKKYGRAKARRSFQFSKR